MIAVRQQLVRHRCSAMILLALVLAMRALIPQGMMAAPDSVRGVAVLLCDGTGVAGRIDLPMGEKHGNARHTQACPFGVLAQAASSDGPDAWAIAPLLPQLTLRQPAPIAFILRAPPRLAPPARAPPVAA
jgi:hypothetical protein